MRATLCLMLVVALPVLAERPPEFREDATLVVTGTIEKLVKSDKGFFGGVMTTYTATVQVAKVEKGEKVKAGDRVQATWFHVTKRPTRPVAGAYGQGHAVKAKDRATFWLTGEKAPYSVIYNRNGIEKMK